MNVSRELTNSISLLERQEAIVKCTNYLIESRQEVLDILSCISSYRAANAEIDSTILTLQGALKEIETHQPNIQESMAVFMPSNVILYSYALYLLVPSLYVKTIHFRPSSHVIEYVNRLHEKLQPIHQLPIFQQKVSQKVFMSDFVQPADIVIFTGSYSNAEQIKKQIQKNQLYIFFGQGINPFIIGPDANIELAVDDVIRMRLFNSGQDCLGPDIILIHESIADYFKSSLIERLDGLMFGEKTDPNANYSPIFYKDILYSISEYFNTNDQFIIYGGGIDFRTKKMEPTILYSEIDQNLEFIEYFSPVFNVVSYKVEEQLTQRISSSYFSERAMGCSLYGSEHLAPFLRKKHTLTINETLEDVDQGNKAFGGYGTMSNYIYYNMKLISKPVLISEIVAEYLVEKEGVNMIEELRPWDVVIKYLQSIGTQHLFGLPSDDLSILKSLPESEIKFIMCKDQRNALFMASGYALTNHQLAVCIVGKGPALTNTITGLLEACHLGVPLLLIALGTGGDKLGTKSFQETDQLSLVKPLVKWSYRVEHLDRLVWALEKATFLAKNGASGPVYIELPEHLIEQSLTIEYPFHALEFLSIVPSPRQLQAGLDLLQHSHKTILLVGGGMQGQSSDIVEQFAINHEAAIFVTASGRGTVDENHPSFCGVAGLYTDPHIRTLWENADLIISLGSRLEETATFEWNVLLQNTPLIQVNIELDDFNLEYSGLKIMGDGYSTLSSWLISSTEVNPVNWLAEINNCKQKAFAHRIEYMEKLQTVPDIHVSELLSIIQEEFPSNITMVQENGLQDMWSYFYPYFCFGKDAHSVVPSDQTSLGFGAAAALGVSIATENPVVALIGDGAFNLFCSDLITAIEYQIPVIYIVLNNGGYGWLQNQLNYQSSEVKNSFSFISKSANKNITSIQNDFVENLDIHNKNDAKEILQLAWKKYQEHKLVIINVHTNLKDIHEKISHIYGDFPVIEQFANSKS
ncbi:hypothetical protein AASFL403_02290 [Paenibacillus nuruki]|nr:hypothetical protein AASFL403_02290 [Paenibacillus nuruki]